MTDAEDVGRYADAIMTMIREDQDSGQVPGDVSSWDELDASVDTDDYYRQARLPSGTSEAAGLRDAVMHEVSIRLAGAQGGPWHARWHTPGGPTEDIGRTMGYPTKAEAELVGQEYVSRHGGAFHVLDG